MDGIVRLALNKFDSFFRNGCSQVGVRFLKEFRDQEEGWALVEALDGHTRKRELLRVAEVIGVL